MKRADDLVIRGSARSGGAVAQRRPRRTVAVLWPVLRDAARRPLLTMTAAIVEAPAARLNVTAAAAIVAPGAAARARHRRYGPRLSSKRGPRPSPPPARFRVSGRRRRPNEGVADSPATA